MEGGGGGEENWATGDRALKTRVSQKPAREARLKLRRRERPTPQQHTPWREKVRPAFLILASLAFTEHAPVHLEEVEVDEEEEDPGADPGRE